MPDQVEGGLMGADHKVENGRYRFARIFNGENWYPTLRAALTQPGVDAKTGEYLISVNGREVHPPESVYSFFENTAGEENKNKIGAEPGGKEARGGNAVSVEDEGSLRHSSAGEDNRGTVAQLRR